MYVVTDLRIGGAEAMLAKLATAHPPIAPEIAIVSLLPADAYAEQLRAAGVEVIELGFKRLGGAAMGLFELARVIAAIKPDIVQGWMYHGDLVALIALGMSGRRGKTCLVWSIRCSDMDLSRYGIGLRLVVKACIALSRLPDMIIANSAAGLETHLRLGYRPRRAEIVANGVAVDRFKPDPAARIAIRKEIGLSQDAIVLAHVARVDPMKDQEGFLAALRELPDVHAVLVGAGTERLPPMPNAVRLGRRDDVARLFAAADIVVSSSAFGEGFSNVLAEGMACGLPAVATDVGDARAIVGDSGLIVPPRDPHALAAAIRTLAQQTASARAERGRRARARVVDNFAIKRAVERYVEIYKSLENPGG